MILNIVTKLFQLLPGSFRWRLVWLGTAKFLVGVRAVVFNEKGEILLLQHRLWKNQPWALPGGYIDRGETPKEACKREVFEESACEITNLEILEEELYKNLCISLIYKAKVKQCNVKVETGEIIKANFFSPKNLPDNFFEKHRKFVKLAVKSLK